MPLSATEESCSRYWTCLCTPKAIGGDLLSLTQHSVINASFKAKQVYLAPVANNSKQTIKYWIHKLFWRWAVYLTHEVGNRLYQDKVFLSQKAVSPLLLLQSLSMTLPEELNVLRILRMHILHRENINIGQGCFSYTGRWSFIQDAITQKHKPGWLLSTAASPELLSGCGLPSQSVSYCPVWQIISINVSFIQIASSIFLHCYFFITFISTLMYLITLSIPTMPCGY